jgi:hypothetical protein
MHAALVAGCIGAVLTMLSACSGYSGSQATASAGQPDRAACEKSGGKIEAIGKAQALACVKYYADGGKACRNDSECESRICSNPDVLDRGVAAEGVCARSDHDRFGCNSRIKDGKVEFAICQD